MCWARADGAGVCVCLNWPSSAVWRGSFGWRCTDVEMWWMMRDVDWARTVPSMAALVGVLEMFTVSHLTGLSRWSCEAWPISAWQLPAVWCCSAEVPCWELCRMAFFWCFEWIKKLLKCYYQKSAWLLNSLLVLYLRQLKEWGLSGLKLTRYYFSCRDCLASASNDDSRPCPYSLCH